MWLLLLPLLSPGATAGPPTPELVAIPAGTFIQGHPDLPDAPPRQTTLGAFRIDQAEVTVADFETFVAEGWSVRSLWSADGWAWSRANSGGAGSALRASGRSPDHPVVAVTFYEAEAYCAWRGGRLPTEAEWERAACGGKPTVRYPWGNSDAVDAPWYSDGKFGRVSSVHTLPADMANPALDSPEGLVHMVGNVWEWTTDYYLRDGYGAEGEERTDPRGPRAGTWRVLRGGSFMNLPSYATCRHREPRMPDEVALTTGFRCVVP